MIQRWMNNPLSASEDVGRIRTETGLYLQNSIQLSQKTFDRFIDLFAFGERNIILGSDHAKPKKS